jgi:DNA adenine methylase
MPSKKQSVPRMQPSLPNVLKLEIGFNKSLRPFLRWAGGKSRIVKFLAKYVPNDFGRYWEPFLGSGALFFFLCPRIAYLSDSNGALIDCFNFVKEYPEESYQELERLARNISENDYFFVRTKYNNSESSIAQAARFIYLNKTSFNGIFRVNMKGEYNVPFGHKEHPSFPNLSDLKSASFHLRNAQIENHTFEQLVTNELIAERDFIYLDPPYPPLTLTSNFTHYTAERFQWEDQEKVAEVANNLSRKGCFVMVTNSDIKAIKSLYKGWNHFSLPVVRWVAANGTRLKVNELIITNYSVKEERE